MAVVCGAMSIALPILYDFESGYDGNMSIDSSEVERTMEQTLPPNFGGNRIHAVQVGLGTNSTFVQNLGGLEEDWCANMDWLLEIVSEFKPQTFTGVGVEPVEEYVKAMRAISCKCLPKVALLQVALGEANQDDVELHVLTKEKNEEILMQVPEHQKEEVTYYLTFLRNMSCAGCIHPAYEEQRRWLQDHYNVVVKLASNRTSVWSYAYLAETLNFKGCELLIIDAEGSDTAILRSLMAYCREEEHDSRNRWPYVIQFETMGHCDRLEGNNAEWNTISELEYAGYILVAYSHYNSQLVRVEALNFPHIHKWVNKLQCWGCNKRKLYPYIFAPFRDGGLSIMCRGCLKLTPWAQN